MNMKQIIILIIGMMLLTIAPASAAVVISEFVFEPDGSTPCNAFDTNGTMAITITRGTTPTTYTPPQLILSFGNMYTLSLNDMASPPEIAVGDVITYNAACDGKTNTTATFTYTGGGIVGIPIVLDPPAAQPDLIVEDITPSGTITNFGSGNVYGLFLANESNDICAKVTNLGAGAAGAFTVEFDVSGTLYTTTVSGLGAGNNTTVCITDTVARPAGTAVTIDVEADSGLAVTESNELNNTDSWGGTVLNNGYKGKKDYTGGSDIDTYKEFCVNGGVNYSAGDSYYLSNSGNPTWTHFNTSWNQGDPVPPTVDIVEARLYVPYCWAAVAWSQNLATYTSMTFNGNTVPMDMSSLGDYWDAKLYDPAATQYGTLVYNVTDDYDASLPTNTACLENTYPGNASMRGMMLVVVYDDGGDTKRRIVLNEGFDMLCAYPERYATTSEEATAWAPFSADLGCCMQTASSRLITFAPGAGGSSGAGEGELIFNGHVWNDAWTDNDAHAIGISDVDVTAYLQSTNEAGFQSDSATHDWMEAMVAILETECSGAIIAIDQPEFVDPQCQFTINITVDPLAGNISAVQYDLYYNTSVVWAEWANPGPFLSQDSADTHVEVREIDNTWDVANHVGRITYAETTLAPPPYTGDLPSVNDPGVLTTIHFSAIGERGTYSYMAIRDALASDPLKQPVELVMEDCGVTIYDNIEPVANASSKYHVSNVASKFQCFAALCCCNSHGGLEDDGEWKGNNIVYVRWDFGDGNYGTSEGLEDCQKHHEYTSWNWNEVTGDYDPFIAYLTVRDDGEPQLSNTTEVPVMVYIAGDTNGDGVVDILDAACVGKHYEQEANNNPPLNCTPYWTDEQADMADLNNDNRVSTIDLMIVGTNWNHLAYPPYIQD